MVTQSSEKGPEKDSKKSPISGGFFKKSQPNQQGDTTGKVNPPSQYQSPSPLRTRPSPYSWEPTRSVPAEEQKIMEEKAKTEKEEEARVEKVEKEEKEKGKGGEKG